MIFISKPSLIERIKFNNAGEVPSSHLEKRRNHKLLMINEDGYSE
jgi:hypothetical protein|tara:strand:- start:516 stop:650 length:135 start_codon:yes stop_codon:yes gene_type:complete